MKQFFRYGIAIAAAVLVVAGSVIVPPAVARSSDNVFLNVVQADGSEMGSYKYKPTKYQKVRVLYEWQMKNARMPVNSLLYYDINQKERAVAGMEYLQTPMPEEAFALLKTEYYYESETSKFPKEVRLDIGEAKTAARAAFDDLGRRGGLPYYAADFGNTNTTIELVSLQDPLVSGTTFYFWMLYVYIEEDQTNYWIIVDDEDGKLYGLNVAYGLDDQTVLEGWDNMKSAKEKAGLFLEPHGLKLKDKVWGEGYASYEDLVYSTDDPDYEAILSMKTNGVIYSVMLKPSDL